MCNEFGIVGNDQTTENLIGLWLLLEDGNQQYHECIIRESVQHCVYTSHEVLWLPIMHQNNSVHNYEVKSLCNGHLLQ